MISSMRSFKAHNSLAWANAKVLHLTTPRMCMCYYASRVRNQESLVYCPNAQTIIIKLQADRHKKVNKYLDLLPNDVARK